MADLVDDQQPDVPQQLGQRGRRVFGELLEIPPDGLEDLQEPVDPPAQLVGVAAVVVDDAAVVAAVVAVRTVRAGGVDDRRRRVGLWRGGHRRAGDRLIGGHGGGGLDPHPCVVGLVDRDRDGVDAEEVGRHQRGVRGVVAGQLRQGRHRGQRGGVGGGRGLLLGGHGRAVRAGPLQPRQIGRVRGNVPLGAGPLPRIGLRRRQRRAEFRGGRRIGFAQRRPGRGRAQQAGRSRPAAEQRGMDLRGERHPHRRGHGRRLLVGLGQEPPGLFGGARVSPVVVAPGPREVPARRRFMDDS